MSSFRILPPRLFLQSRSYASPTPASTEVIVRRAPATTSGALTCRNAAPYCAAPIRQRHLKQLLRTAALLPGPKVEIAPWNRLAQLGAVSPDSSATEAPSPAE